jgi:hypothetical protein
MKKARWPWTILWAGLLLALAACGGGSEEEEALPTAAETAAPAGGGLGTPAPKVPTGSTVGYGMCVDWGSYVERALALTKDANFNWVKYQVRWADQEPLPGSIDLDKLDSVISQANGYGFHVLLSVVTAPDWSRPADTDLSVPGPPEDPADYANFVGLLAERYMGYVDAYEVWNEQNLWYEWGGQGRLNAGDYVELLKAAYTAIKAADPAALVISGGLTPTGVDDGVVAVDDVRYLQQMYDAGLKEYCDGVGAHPGGYNNPPDDDPEHNTTSTTTFKGHPSFYYKRFEQYHEVMANNGDDGKQLWFSEFGWASSDNPPASYEFALDNTEEMQAQYLVRAFELAKEAGYVGPMFLWDLNFGPAAEPGDSKAKKPFSILRDDWSPRPAFDAVAEMPKDP